MRGTAWIRGVGLFGVCFLMLLPTTGCDDIIVREGASRKPADTEDDVHKGTAVPGSPRWMPPAQPSAPLNASDPADAASRALQTDIPPTTQLNTPPAPIATDYTVPTAPSSNPVSAPTSPPPSDPIGNSGGAQSSPTSARTAYVELSTGIALAQTTPGIGTCMGFGVTYEFTEGQANPSSKYFWVIESDADGSVSIPVALRNRGELYQFVAQWRQNRGPYHCHVDEVPAGGGRRTISESLVLR